MSYYATLSHTNFLKSGIYFTFTACLNLNLPHFKCRSHVVNGFHIGQHRSRGRKVSLTFMHGEDRGAKGNTEQWSEGVIDDFGDAGSSSFSYLL